MKDSERDFLALIAIGSFRVDSQGRIWRNRVMVGGSHVGTPSYEDSVKPSRAERSSTSREGYLKVMFSFGNRRKAVYAHRIVWMVRNQADILKGLEMNHKDGNKRNNHPSNLEIVTRQQNVVHSFRVLNQKTKEQRGELNPAAKVTAEDVLVIRELAGKISQSQIAKRFGITQQTVSAIVRRLAWTHL